MHKGRRFGENPRPDAHDNFRVNSVEHVAEIQGEKTTVCRFQVRADGGDREPAVPIRPVLSLLNHQPVAIGSPLVYDVAFAVGAIVIEHDYDVEWLLRRLIRLICLIAHLTTPTDLVNDLREPFVDKLSFSVDDKPRLKMLSCTQRLPATRVKYVSLRSRGHHLLPIVQVIDERV